MCHLLCATLRFSSHIAIRALHMLFVLSDCAVCTEGYGRSLSNTCHYCGGATAHLLIAACTLSSLVTILLLFLVVVFLVGGLDAVSVVRQSVVREFYKLTKGSAYWRPMPDIDPNEQNDPSPGPGTDSMGGSIAPVDNDTSDVEDHGNSGDIGHHRTIPPKRCERNKAEPMCGLPQGDVVGAMTGVRLSPVSRRRPPSQSHEVTYASQHTRRSSVASPGKTEEVAAIRGEEPNHCGRGKKVKCWQRRLPMDRLKILIGVWQILAVFTSITGVQFPDSYSVFLSWINILNFDLGYIISASCVLPSVNFYQRLLATTIAPFVVAVGLTMTYRIAKGRAGIGLAGLIARKEAWSRHVTAGLLLTFLVRICIIVRLLP